MSSAASTDSARPRSLLDGLTLSRVAWTTLLAALATASVIPFVDNSYLDLFVSALCVGYTIMALVTVAGNLDWRWIPAEAAQILAVMIGSIAGTVLTGLIKGRELNQMFHERLWGVIATASMGIGFGCVIVLIYIFREQHARAAGDRARADAEHERLQRQVLTAQLQLLQAQVEPHFLFNTLANVQHLVTSDPATASRVLASLIRYLRASLPQMREETTNLGREIEMVRAYLDIQALRMGGRMSFAIEIPAALAAVPFPPMMLISLVENAIKHGIDPLPMGGEVKLSAWIEGGQMHVNCSDSGAGLGEHTAMGVGLTNIRERLESLFGAAGRLEIVEASQRGVSATIVIPAPVAMPIQGAEL